MQVAWRRIIEDVNRTAEGYLLAASGGVDSMFMADFFLRNCRVPFRMAYFDHGLRESSGEDGALVREWCIPHGIPFVLGRGDPDAMRLAPSLEAEARRQRYGFLEAALLPCELLVTAHHANDQVETVIMRLMRGVPEGSLRMKRLSGRRFRPFLSVPKSEILRRASERGLGWVEDLSNDDLRHERNWVRHVLIPQMMERRNILRTIGSQQLDGAGCARPVDGETSPTNC